MKQRILNALVGVAVVLVLVGVPALATTPGQQLPAGSYTVATGGSSQTPNQIDSTGPEGGTIHAFFAYPGLPYNWDPASGTYIKCNEYYCYVWKFWLEDDVWHFRFWVIEHKSGSVIQDETGTLKKHP